MFFHVFVRGTPRAATTRRGHSPCGGKRPPDRGSGRADDRNQKLTPVRPVPRAATTRRGHSPCGGNVLRTGGNHVGGKNKKIDAPTAVVPATGFLFHLTGLLTVPVLPLFFQIQTEISHRNPDQPAFLPLF